MNLTFVLRAKELVFARTVTLFKLSKSGSVITSEERVPRKHDSQCSAVKHHWQELWKVSRIPHIIPESRISSVSKPEHGGKAKV